MNETSAEIVNKEKPTEQELIKAAVMANIAVELPILPENVESAIQIELDYKKITQSVNDYIERYTIDPRISEIDYQLSTPKLPDEYATKNLKECLTGESDAIITSNDTIQVDNKAIADEKVTLLFELSVEENVYPEENVENTQPRQDKHQSEKLSRPNTKSAHSTKESLSIDDQTKGELIIQSSDSNLYWQNSASAQLYWQNAPSNISHKSSNISMEEDLDVEDLDFVRNTFSGLENAMDHCTAGRLGYRVTEYDRQEYTTYKNGKKFYLIVGNYDRYARYLRNGGRIVNCGTILIQTGIQYSQAKTPQGKGRVVGASLGQVSAGIAAGAMASWVTTAVFLSIATAAGVASAPVTIVVIAGASIIAGALASNAVEQFGKDIGGNLGEGVVNYLQNSVNETKQILEWDRTMRMEEAKTPDGQIDWKQLNAMERARYRRGKYNK